MRRPDRRNSDDQECQNHPYASSCQEIGFIPLRLPSHYEYFTTMWAWSPSEGRSQGLRTKPTYAGFQRRRTPHGDTMKFANGSDVRLCDGLHVRWRRYVSMVKQFTNFPVSLLRLSFCFRVLEYPSGWAQHGHRSCCRSCVEISASAPSPHQ